MKFWVFALVLACLLALAPAGCTSQEAINCASVAQVYVKDIGGILERQYPDANAMPDYLRTVRNRAADADLCLEAAIRLLKLIPEPVDANHVSGP